LILCFQNDPQQNDTPPRYGQIYIYDSDAAVGYRMHVRQNENCHEAIMQTIDQEMRRVSPYVEQYRNLHAAAKNGRAVAHQEGMEQIRYELRLIRNPRNADPRRYNAPVTNKECMFLVESGDGEIGDLDLAVHPIGRRGCVRISHTSRHIDPMVFHCCFPMVIPGGVSMLQMPSKVRCFFSTLHYPLLNQQFSLMQRLIYCSFSSRQAPNTSAILFQPDCYPR
jgi:hypothetical protein